MSFSLGRYVPYQSLIHKLDPRVKILSTILMMVCVFMSYKSWAMEALMQGIILVVCIILLASDLHHHAVSEPKNAGRFLR